MGSLVTLSFDNGKVGFASSVRGVDDAGHDMFRIELPQRPILYGEWRPKWAENHNDFDIEILRFGYVDAGNVGNNHPGARRTCSSQERAVIVELVCALFSSVEARAGIAPFTSKKATFLGHIHFVPGWIFETESRE